MDNFSLAAGLADAGTSRRHFLQGLAGVAGALTAGAALAPPAAAAPAGAGGSATAGSAPLQNVQIGLFLDKEFAAVLDSVEGGDAFAEVIVDPDGTTSGRKYLGGRKYSNIVLKKSADFTPVFHDWLSTSVHDTPAPRSGEIVVADATGSVRRRLAFSNALITEVAFPACDAASKDAAGMTVTLAPESASRQAAGDRASALGGGKSKAWLPSNFRLQIDGLDCARVNKIEALTIKQKVMEFERGAGAVREFSDLRITLPESASQTWLDWFEDFVIKGNNGAGQERSGSLTYLSPQGDEILTLQLKQLGIFKLTHDRVEAGEQQAPHTVVDMFSEFVLEL